jgi:hypothetical protein
MVVRQRTKGMMMTELPGSLVSKQLVAPPFKQRMTFSEKCTAKRIKVAMMATEEFMEMVFQ